ncbi:acyltransferase family protein [Ferruginibacter sp. SUN002]|uniref:acyltransferase family protein n=1 Tax=Ferruginibacter sp. SUN002 TaxID=2937789 RepID=UPI003D36E4C2
MLSAFNSQKFRFWSFVSMALLVFVHAYNLNENYLQPWTMPHEPLTFTTFTEYWLANGLFRFRIPMLFMISGYLFAIGDTKLHKQRVGKRVRTLLYPYLIWSAVGLLLTYVLELFPYSRNVVDATHMMQISDHTKLLHQYQWYEVLARWIFFPVSYQLWFIRVLLIYNLAYPAIRWCVLHPMVRWIFFSVVILLWIATFGSILFEGEGLLFFSLGVWLQKKNFNIDVANKWLNPNLWGIVFISVSVIKTILAFQSYFNGIEPVLLFMHKIVVLSGLITVWYGCNRLVKFFMGKRWFVWLSAFSFMIYAVHAPLVLYATKAFMLEMHHFNGYRMFIFILLPIILIFLAIIKAAILRKGFPKLYSFLTGGRGLQ